MKSAIPKNTIEILDQRAKLLSRSPRDGEESTHGIEVSTFEIGQEHYALELSFVREILKPQLLTPLPRTPNFFSGLCNLRGELLLVVDLAKFFQLSIHVNPKECDFIVLGDENAEFALLAESANQVRHITPEQLYSNSNSVGTRPEFIKGVTSEGLILLNAELLLTHPSFTLEES